MLDALSLDQLRTFITAADEGSFSAASRKLLRAQSVISQTISNLENQIGVSLFDRSGRYPKLTLEGQVLLGDARAIIQGVEAFKSKSKGMSAGLEPELSVVVDVMFPMNALTLAARDFAVEFPATPLRLYVEALGGVVQQIISGQCSLGVIGSLPDVPDGLRLERLLGMLMVMVVASDHPLAGIKGPVTKAELSRYTQIILTDRTTISDGRSFGIMSPNIWKLADFEAKKAFLLAGLGWGGMPMPAVKSDIASGRLIRLHIEDDPPGGMILPMSIVYPSDCPPGPAGRWLIEKLKACSQAYEASLKAFPQPSTL